MRRGLAALSKNCLPRERLHPKPSSPRKGIKSDKGKGRGGLRGDLWRRGRGVPEEGRAQPCRVLGGRGEGGWGAPGPRLVGADGRLPGLAVGPGVPSLRREGGRDGGRPAREGGGGGAGCGLALRPARVAGRASPCRMCAVLCARPCSSPSPPLAPSPPPAARSERQRHTAPGRSRRARRDAEQVAGGCGRRGGERRGEPRARRGWPGRTGHAS